MKNWLISTSWKLITALYLLLIRGCCAFVYYSLPPVFSRTVHKSMAVRFPFSTRMLRVSMNRTNLWSLAVVSLPKSTPPETSWHEPVFTLRYSTVERDGEIVVVYFTRFSRHATAHRHWSCSIRQDPSASNSLARPRWSTLRSPMTGSRSGRSSTDSAVPTSTDQSVSRRSLAGAQLTTAYWWALGRRKTGTET